MRLYFLYITHPTDDTANALAQCCLAILKKSVRYYVNVVGICPSFLGPETFAEDAFELAVEKFWRGLHGPRPPRQLIAWLKTVAYSAVVEEYRSRVRRTEFGALHFEPPESEVFPDAD